MKGKKDIRKKKSKKLKGIFNFKFIVHIFKATAIQIALTNPNMKTRPFEPDIRFERSSIKIFIRIQPIYSLQPQAFLIK